MQSWFLAGGGAEWGVGTFSLFAFLEHREVRRLGGLQTTGEAMSVGDWIVYALLFYTTLPSTLPRSHFSDVNLTPRLFPAPGI